MFTLGIINRLVLEDLSGLEGLCSGSISVKYFGPKLNYGIDYYVDNNLRYYHLKKPSKHLLLLYLGLQQRIDKIDKNRLLNALATNLVVDSLRRAINKLLIGAALFTASRRQVGSRFMHAHSEL